MSSSVIDWDLAEMLFILAIIVGFLVLSCYISNDKLKPGFKKIAASLGAYCG
jgi:hypothetical protein